MQPLAILLLEDNLNDAKKVEEVLFPYYAVSTYHCVGDAKRAAKNKSFDLAIVDISLEEKNSGIQFAKYLLAKGAAFPFLFLTSLQSRSIFEEAKLTHPYSYLLKPFNPLELQYAIELALAKFHKQPVTPLTDDAFLDTKHVFVRSQNRIFKINIQDIEYIKVEDIYCTIHTPIQKHLVRLSLKKMKKLLHPKDFKQVHRKYLVNINKVLEFNLTENTLYLQSKRFIAISERYKRNLSDLIDIIG